VGVGAGQTDWSAPRTSRAPKSGSPSASRPASRSRCLLAHQQPSRIRARSLRRLLSADAGLAAFDGLSVRVLAWGLPPSRWPTRSPTGTRSSSSRSGRDGGEPGVRGAAGRPPVVGRRASRCWCTGIGPAGGLTPVRDRMALTPMAAARPRRAGAAAAGVERDVAGRESPTGRAGARRPASHDASSPGGSYGEPVRALEETPDGLVYREEFISDEEEDQLLALLSSIEFRAVVMRGQAARRTVRTSGSTTTTRMASWCPPIRCRTRCCGCVTAVRR
jgi:hypothetical protein